MTPTLSAALRLLSLNAAPRRGLFLVITSALVGIVAIFAVALYSARTDARTAAEVSSGNLATALAQDLARNIELLDLSIQAARDAWLDPRTHGLEPELQRALIFDHSASARYIDAILVLDGAGNVVADSRSAVMLRHENLAEAPYFRAQVAQDAGLFVSQPIASTEPSGWSLAFSRRMSRADGSFAGVAVGFFHLGYLKDAYARIHLAPGSAMTLFNTDGTLLVREPSETGMVGRSFRGSPTFSKFSTGAEGSFEGISAVDGMPRFYSYHRVGSLPLVQNVALSTDAVYAEWKIRATVLGGVLVLLCGTVLALLFVLKSELLQRAAAEAALEVLASHDPLTGLLNRRRFFALAEERRAETAVRGPATAVLMIDADHFKSYNDCYGHVAGDAVLVSLARAISGEIRRSTDLVARFGGEEFIAFLPGTSGEHAFMIAEAIRKAVARLDIKHARSNAGIVTVSIGVAWGENRPLGALVELADQELYRSKRDGRNCTSLAGAEDLGASERGLGEVGRLSA